ncbi:MAG: homoserine dehydrogenase [Vicinamibacterales bacterium]|nr:homoserine dehydrogenase [Vicinamibacterales bacterium]
MQKQKSDTASLDAPEGVVGGAPLTVAIVGFGTVGRSVAKVLSSGMHPSLRLAMICNRGVERKKVDWVPRGVEWTESIEAVIGSDADIVVELMGGLEPAGELIRRSLQAGKSVVTANKQLIATHGIELLVLARRHKRELLFEASVAGGIPIVRAVREGLAGDRLFRIAGILNGTCNYILTRMDGAGLSFADALKEAQVLGYAEADPTADVDGYDARAKIAILIASGLGCQVNLDDIPCRSISSINNVDFMYARRLDCTIRQVSWAERAPGVDRQLFASVRPALVPLSSPLARVEGSQNLVTVQGEFGGANTFSGFGAGGDPTAVAIVSDLMSIARTGLGAEAHFVQQLEGQVSVGTDFTSPHYVRFTVADRPGIIASLATLLSAHGINIDAVLQLPGHDKAELPFVMTVEACPLSVLDAALADINALPFHVCRPMAVPILGAQGNS